MDIKICVFDIDDTLCQHGQLWPANGRALRQLHQRGYPLALATGRSLPMLPPDIAALVREGLICATVCANGQHNTLRGQTISALPLPLAELEALIALCRRFGLIYQLAGAEKVGLSAYLPRFDHVASVFPCFSVNPDFHKQAEIYQFSVHLPDGDFNAEEFSRELAQLKFTYVPWHSPGADLIPQRTSKLDGLRTVVEALGYGLENVMAFGDGLNDLQLIAGVGLGVAMGNGAEELKRVARYVTLPLVEDGISHALNHFQLL